MTWTGVDLGKAYTQICELSDDGQIWEVRIPTTRTRILETFRRRSPGRLVLEASTESEWVARVLESLGYEVIVADPNYAPMYAQRNRRIKTDRRDALALAHACRVGAYRPAHRMSDPRRHIRGLLATRDALVRTRTRWILVVRALLRREGLRVRSGKAECFTTRVHELEVPPDLRTEVEPMLALLGPLNDTLRALDSQLAAMAQEDATMSRLTSVPGVGPVTALSFVATVDRIDRFHGPHQVAAYLGLVPREWSSSECIRRGRITKTGDKRTRWLLGEAARCVMRLRTRADARVLREWAEQLAKRRGTGIAVVALSRRLAGILYALWRDGTLYDQATLHAPTPRPSAA
jgi:transposase